MNETTFYFAILEKTILRKRVEIQFYGIRKARLEIHCSFLAVRVSVFPFLSKKAFRPESRGSCLACFFFAKKKEGKRFTSTPHTARSFSSPPYDKQQPRVSPLSRHRRSVYLVPSVPGRCCCAVQHGAFFDIVLRYCGWRQDRRGTKKKMFRRR